MKNNIIDKICTGLKNCFKRIKSNKVSLIVCCAALLCAVTATTLALITVINDPIKNVFIGPKLDNEIVETFEEGESGMEKSSIKIKNNGTIDEFVRVAVVVNWKNEDGSVSAKKVNEGDYTLEVNTEAWTLKEKYWYHNTSVAKDATTEEFLKSGTKVALTEQGKSNVPDGYFLSVEILADSIQATPVDAIEESWGFSAEDGTIVFEEGGNE